MNLGIIIKDNVFGSVAKKVKEIWEKWRDRIADKDRIDCFVYPKWCRNRERRQLNEGIYWGFGAGVFFLILVVSWLIEQDWKIANIGLLPFIGGILITMLSFSHFFYCLHRRLVREFDEIRIYGNDIEVLFEDGSVRRFDVRDIRKYRLTNTWNIGKIVFRDGTTLRDVERVTYWPVLRDRLLTRLE